MVFAPIQTKNALYHKVVIQALRMKIKRYCIHSYCRGNSSICEIPPSDSCAYQGFVCTRTVVAVIPQLHAFIRHINLASFLACTCTVASVFPSVGGAQYPRGLNASWRYNAYCMIKMIHHTAKRHTPTSEHILTYTRGVHDLQVLQEGKNLKPQIHERL